MSVKLLNIDKDYAERIEKAGKTSTSKEPSDPEGFTKRIVKLEHLSLGRFANATFEIECSRACGNQLVRHNHLNYCQLSQRYVEFPKIDSDIVKNPGQYKISHLISEIEKYIIIPNNIKYNKKVLFDFILTCIDTITTYHFMLDNGILREDARSILPLCCKTKIVLSGNFQALLDFCSLRSQKEAQSEIREIAQEMFNILCKEAPNFFGYFKGENKICKKKIWI